MSKQLQSEDFVLGGAFASILTEATQSLVCVLDEAGRILFFNQACERATGEARRGRPARPGAARASAGRDARGV